MARSGGTGQQLSYGQLEGLWNAAGGPPRLAPLMAAIAMAESGGRSDATNPTDNNGTQTSWGLWQISDGTHNPPPNWADPLGNARLAVAKWKSQGLHAWGTYNSLAYQKFFKRGVAPVDPAGGIGGTVGIPYWNPFRGVKGLTAERVDMGVDYAGTGPVFAVGPGVITYSGIGDQTGWGPSHGGLAPGGYVKERITAGPLRGRSVYFAEAFTPAVRVGQRVTAQTQIGTMSGGIETGFADPGPGTAALGASQFGGNNPTAYGEAYSKILAKLGAPAGLLGGQQPRGTVPPWLANAVRAITSGNFGPGGPGLHIPDPFSGLGSIGSAIQNIAGTFEGFADLVDWLIQPANWVRIIAGVGGGVLVIGGVVVLSHVGAQVPIPVAGGSVSARPAALPVGILMVGGGGVLLFVAFHNLGAANVGDLLGSLRDQAQAAAAGSGKGGGVSAAVGGP